MPKKFLLIIALFVVFLFTNSSVALAATLKLNNIGTSVTAGKTFTDWTYSKSNPKFEGEADANQEVTIKIDDTVNKVTSDVDGNWSFTPASLTEGDYEVTISAGSQYITFNLHISDSATPTPTGTASGSSTTKGGQDLPEELPKTGSGLQTTTMVVTGLGLMLGAVFAWGFIDEWLAPAESGVVPEEELDE